MENKSHINVNAKRVYFFIFFCLTFFIFLSYNFTFLPPSIPLTRHFQNIYSDVTSRYLGDILNTDFKPFKAALLEFSCQQYYRLHVARYVLIDVVISEHIAPF